jgi:hypothetical protein
MATVESPLQLVQSILKQQKDAGRPSQEICTRIAGLKDLVEIGPVGGPSFHDWRRGGGSGGGGGNGGASGNQGGANGSIRGYHSRSMNGFRGGTPASSPVPTSPSTPLSAPAISFRRVTSYNSTASAESAASTTSMPPLGQGSPAARYQSKFKNSNQPVESKILNNIILSKLNKFSPATYADIRDFLYQILGSGEPDLTEMIRDFMMLVFRKAASEEVYCALYAKLLAEISSRYTVILEEMHKLHNNYLEVFDDIVEVPEGGDGYEEFVAKNREKRYRQGYSQFLSELAALEILSQSALEQSVQKLMNCIRDAAEKPEKKTLVEEYVDCLVRMVRVLRKKRTAFADAARTALLDLSGETLASCIGEKEKYASLSPKARFLLMDVKDILEGK